MNFDLLSKTSSSAKARPKGIMESSRKEPRAKK
jgi:hypothetical protein